MSNNVIERLFKLQEHGTTVRTEIIAGLTTFAAMSYILVVNPGILGLSGMPVEGLITVTAIAACIGTLMMALMTNYPIALAPGMGLNAFFAFTICLGREIPWEAALGIVFWNGILFLLLSLTGVRTKIAESIPPSLKIGVQCGIGLFTLIGAFIPTENGTLTATPSAVVGMPESISNTFMAMDFWYPIDHLAETWDLIFALMFVNMFDTIGTLIGVSRKANLLTSEGKLPKIGSAMTADASASIAGALVGTSPVTSYVESATGVSAGGRTGLTAVVVSVCFLLSLFLTPLMKVIPLMATTPALLMVGILMMESIRQVDFDDLGALATASVALIAMPLTFSISEGIALGFITYVGIKVGTGKFKEVTPLTYALAIVFLLRYLLDLK